MRKAWSILFVVAAIGFLCLFFYTVGTTKVGHNQRVIIAPERVNPGEQLKCIKSGLDTLILTHISDTVQVIDVNSKYKPPRQGIDPEKAY